MESRKHALSGAGSDDQLSRDRESVRILLRLPGAGTICSDPAMVSISVRKERYSYDIIRETGEFVINLTTNDLTFATDYCGVKSGKGCR